MTAQVCRADELRTGDACRPTDRGPSVTLRGVFVGQGPNDGMVVLLMSADDVRRGAPSGLTVPAGDRFYVWRAS